MKKLDLYQALWGMIDLPMNQEEDPIEVQLKKIEAAGFDGVLHFIDDTNEATLIRTYEITTLIQQSNLKLGLSCLAYSADDARWKIEYAKEQSAEFLNVMVKDYFITGKEATLYLEEIVRIGMENEVTVLIETHRGTVTQDLIRATEYVRSIDDMRLTIDLSHYVVGCELDVTNDKFEAHFDQLLRRTGSCHLRISNGEQVQLPIHLIEDEQLNNFMRWWKKGAKYYFEQNKAPLPIVVELGPTPYHQRLKNPQGEWVEACDRWEESLRWKEKIQAIVE